MSESINKTPYKTDKSSRKEKLVLGLSGGLASYVTAYLLKIQNYELLGVTIVNSLEDFTGDQNKILSCHLNQTKLDEIKEFCGKLGIPHKVIKTGLAFKEKVIESWAAQKISAEYPTQCWSCHELRMNSLFEAMKDAGAAQMATGHFAKILHNETSRSVSVHTSNDENEDQSALLSRLSHEVLSKLVLPLSDLTSKEIFKLAENFGLIKGDKKIKIHECLDWNSELETYLNSKIPAVFLKGGGILFGDKQLNFGEHKGAPFYSYGSPLEIGYKSQNEKLHIAGLKFSDKTLLVEAEKHFRNNKLQLIHCTVSDEVNFIEPFKGFISLGSKKEIECWVMPKSLASVHIEFTEEHKLLDGEIATVVKKKGRNSKVLLTGEVKLLPNDEEEGESSVSKVNYRIDF